MATFKIRDLMVAIRPGLQTPQRPVALEDCDPGVGSIVCFAEPRTGGGGCDDDSGVDCGDSCFDCTDTCGCTGTCGCTDTCGCTNTCGCTATCGAVTCGCTATCRCTATCGCTDACTNRCTRLLTNCGAESIRPPVIARMAASDLAKLKTQLSLAMKQVSQRESVLAAAAEAKAVVPQTLAQVDALEQKLSEAMEELRARRVEIQKAAGPANKKSADDEK